MQKPAARFAVVAVGALGLIACSIGEASYETVENPVRKVSTIKTCTGAFAKPELASLTACGDGQGHCYSGMKTPLPQLPACTRGSGDTCIPDKVLQANGGKLKACTFLNGKPGACMSLLVKEIADHKGQLQPDVCPMSATPPPSDARRASARSTTATRSCAARSASTPTTARAALARSRRRAATARASA